MFASRKTVEMLLLIKHEISSSITESGNFQRLLNSDATFDVILVESMFCDELLGLGYHFNAPVISISPVMESTEMYGFTAIPSLKSFVPNIYNSYTDKMHFWLRLHNMLTYIGIHYVARTPKWPQYQRNYEAMFQNPSNPPSLQELKRNVSLILLNSHSTLIPSRPLLSNIIEVGGLAISTDESQMLPIDLQIFLDSAKTGAVYFSLGSVVNTTHLTIESNMIILNVFNELPNVKFLVKGNGEMQKLARSMPNVIVRSWFPQQSILQHSNVKCCIVHGGVNSVQESIYHSKPIIVIPFYFDQFINARWAHESGYGIELPFSEFTQSRFKSAIESILFNERFVYFEMNHIGGKLPDFSPF